MLCRYCTALLLMVVGLAQAKLVNNEGDGSVEFNFVGPPPKPPTTPAPQPTCQPGKYLKGASQATAGWCANCNAGTFQDQTSRSSCKSCPAGRFHEHAGQTSCKDCPHGRHTDGKTGQLSCTFVPVPKGWNMWSSWGACDATCGAGVHRRTRTCTLPQRGGTDCVGKASEARRCFNAPCAVERLPTDKMVVFSKTKPSKMPGCTLFHCGAAGLCSTCAGLTVQRLQLHDTLRKLQLSTAAAEAASAANRAQLQELRATLADHSRDAFSATAKFPEGYPRGD